jgi:hypothetical protein
MKLAKLSLITAMTLGTLVALTATSRAEDAQDTPKSADQPAAHQRQRRNAQSQFEHMAAQLKLSDDQKTKLQPIVQEEAKKLKELREDTTLDAKQRRAKVREVRDGYTAKIKPILTSDQFEQYKKLRTQSPNRPAAPKSTETPSEPAPAK